MHSYAVVVTNNGTVYLGDDEEAALAAYDAHVEQTKRSFGRFAGQSVTLWFAGLRMKSTQGVGVAA